MSRFTSAVSGRLGTFLRYGAGSLVAMACSEVVLIGAYAVAGAGALVATVLAWTAGAAPNYVLNQRWAWRVEGEGEGEESRPRVSRSAARRRELALYWGITFCTATAAIVATALMDAWIKGAVPERGMQSLLVAMAYLLAYGVVFVAKFVLFDNVVFAARRSRHQVPRATRA